MNIPYRFLSVAALLACMVPDGRAANALALDDAARKAVLETLSARMRGEYVFPDKAKRVAERLLEQENAGAYRNLRDARQLAAALTADLRQPTSDRHLRVLYSATPIPETQDNAAPSAESERAFRRMLKAENYGVRKVEALPTRIGYLDLRSFAPLPYSRATIGAAMTLVADTDALIIDLRNNGGGDPHTVAFMSSYLFDKRTHLNDQYWRRGNRTEAFWTHKQVPGKKFGGSKHVYVLTSPYTFSGAEELAYNLKQLGRGLIVGETTGGGAHPGQEYRLHPHLSVFIPGGRAINPVSKTNWEGSGVAPDVQAKAADALQVAERLAVEELLKSPADDDHAQALRERLQELQHAARRGPDETGAVAPLAVVE